MPNTPISANLGLPVQGMEEQLLRLRQLNAETYERLKQSRDLDSQDTIQSARKTVDAQMAEWERLRNHRKAFSDEFIALQKQMNEAMLLRPDVLPEDILTKKQLQTLREGLRATEVLYAEHQGNLDKIAREREEQRDKLNQQFQKAAKEREEEAETRRQRILGLTGTVGGGIAKLSQGTEGGVATGIGGAIQSIASSKTTWDLLLNVTTSILSVAAGMYQLSLKRAQQQLQVAGGTSEFYRYANSPEQFYQAKRTLSQLETSNNFAKHERPGLVSALGAIRKNMPGVDLGNTDAVLAEMNKLGVVASYLGKDMGELGDTVSKIAQRTGNSFDHVLAQAAGLGAVFDSLGDNTRLSRQKFVEDSFALTDAMRSQRFEVSDSMRVVGRWAAALQDGTISLHQLVQMVQGHRTGDVGTQAFLAPGALDYFRKNAKGELGGDLGARLVSALEKQSAVGQAETVRVLRGGLSSSIAIRELLGKNLTNDQIKSIGITANRGTDASITKQLDAFGRTGADTGTRWLNQRLLQEGLGNVGRPTQGLDDDPRRRLARGGLYGTNATIQTDTDRESPVNLSQVGHIAGQSFKVIDKLRKDTNSVLDDAERTLKGALEAGMINAAEIFKTKGAVEGGTIFAKQFLEELTKQGPVPTPGNIAVGVVNALKNAKAKK